MNRSTNELMKRIQQKNITLDSLVRNDPMEERKIQQLMAELDSLLYQYYKLLRCN